MLVLGEDAQKHGLTCSLLERLHNVYSMKEFYEASKPFCVALLTNYRSHNALLALPSYLFYGSALVTAAKSVHQIRNSEANYPLHFVCTSIDNPIQYECIKNGTNEQEVKIILDEVKNCIKKWPIHDWGPKHLKKICIMTTTANQV